MASKAKATAPKQDEHTPLTMLAYLNEQAELMEDQLDELYVELQLAPLDNDHLAENLIALREVKRLAAKLNNLREDANRERKRFEVELHTWCGANNVEGHRTDGSLFVPQQKEYATVQDLDAFVEWARENDPSLIKTVGRDSELNRLIKQRLDDNEPMPPGLGFYVRETISVRAA